MRFAQRRSRRSRLRASECWLTQRRTEGSRRLAQAAGLSHHSAHTSHIADQTRHDEQRTTRTQQRTLDGSKQAGKR